jgi:hypothetical protein
MATNTYVALDKITLSSATNTLTFTSIPQGYTDLVLVVSGQFASGTDYPVYQFNGDTSSNYSDLALRGTGSAAQSGGAGNRVFTSVSSYGATSSQPFVFYTNFMNYSNTTTHKSCLSRWSNAATETGENAGLWRSNTAINSIRVYSLSGNNFIVGSTFSLYGIAAEGVSPAPKATGGAIYSDTNYYYHVFGSTGVFTPSSTLSCDYLVVAGGGGGGGQQGAGGGAGGVRAFTSASLSATNYAVTVGAGGPGGGGNATTSRGSSGNTSTFNSNSVSGGGGACGNGTYGAALSGGSGGGGGINNNTAGAGNTGGYSPVEGYAGGTGAGNGGAGGGGAGGVGVSVSGLIAGNGGVGSFQYNAINFSSWLTATGVGQNVSGTYYVAGGGGGGNYSGYTVGTGGFGGGGTGSTLEAGTPVWSQRGSANTGGGGGGGGQTSNDTAYGGAGGSGVVIVRYLKA